MSSLRGEGAIVGLVLVASGSVLAAPVLGRLGAAMLADAAMWTAAGCGIVAFALGARATVRAARPSDRQGSEEQ